MQCWSLEKQDQQYGMDAIALFSNPGYKVPDNTIVSEGNSH